VGELLLFAAGRFRLVFAGEARFSDAEGERRVEAALAGVDHLVDRVGWQAPAEFFSSVDLAVFPSVQAETFGLVVAQAQYAGVPFVITDAGALPEVAGPQHPWVVASGSPDTVADMIEAAATADDPSILAAARQRWAKHYSPEAGRKRLAAYFSTVLPHSNGRAFENAPARRT